ncbi:MAG TPA: type 1 glutamine amidotransferase [Nitrospirota bacterium]
MNVLIIKNIFSEGPGTMGDHLRKEGIPHSVVELGAGEPAPGIDAFTHILVMGGPMAVYEMDQYPYLKNEARFIETAVKANKCVLGVCLGAQMLAHVLGARVYPGGTKEIGWYEVALTDGGMNDPLMSALALPGKNAAQVFQWHGDTFDLPADAVRLASSDIYPNQAFRYGDRAYALQFHIEVTPAIVSDWLKHEKGIDFARITSESKRIYGAYRDRAMRFYEGFFSEL